MRETSTELQPSAHQLRYGKAAESVTHVAAPLLAGGAVAMLGGVAADAEKFRWPDQALLLLAAAGVLLVACVQWGFRARPYLYSLKEVEDWRGAPLTGAERAAHLEQQREDLGRWRRGANLAAASYNLGIVALGVAVALLLAPPPQPEAAAGAAWRWAAFGIVLTASVAELLWTLLEWGDGAALRLEQHWRLRRARNRAQRLARTGEQRR
ncbi:hypothetical protein ACFV1B_24085 [Streptomyces sp. NPDC059637]|uniref:hypothetical protein n=1 Tax=Streptomyces sp. NPDC059637 TaxID=3347752 RepID=UPI00368D17D3